jgi:hypothetical protein
MEVYGAEAEIVRVYNFDISKKATIFIELRGMLL